MISESEFLFWYENGVVKQVLGVLPLFEQGNSKRDTKERIAQKK